MSAPATRRARTRTGCKTCRQRKLKCDEIRPVCGHCRKSNRVCQPSEGIAFRHAQNAGFVDQDGGDELGNFYKYRQKFNNTYFLPVPQELNFIHITDPYADESSAQQVPQQSTIPPATQYQHPQYVDVAATSLKAMIDPSLEASTSSGHNLETANSAGQETIAPGDMAEAESLNETILKALKQSNEEMRRL